MALQWCVSTSRSEALPFGAVPSAQRFVGAVWVGDHPSGRPVQDALEALGSVGIDRRALVLRVSAPRGTEEQTLAELGLPGCQMLLAAPPPGFPGRLRPELGPCLTLELPLGPPCSTGCGPGCPCGRYRQLAYGQVVRRVRLRDGRLVPESRPTFELLLPEYAVMCALAEVRSPFALPELRPLMDGLAAAVPDFAAGRCRESEGLMVADRLSAVALLLGSGVTPGPRGRAHVTRRLLRGAAATTALAGGSPSGVTRLLSLADATVRVPLGLPRLTDHALATVEREIGAFERVLTLGHARFLDAVRTLRGPEEVPPLLVRLRSEQGLPLGLLLSWCRQHDLALSLREVAELDLTLRAGGSNEADPS
ncbi:alanyl-tRNA synthetase [Kitasatospora gansuensis]|uniref:Alanyl-tRNA synthetase n=1 Tax=Kitasatospora gansuensis TaxID=258050 RepID=A0A7W7WHS1_9ACTN|nr:hypothetical protein [Kitasatospora gansuensis]MBB4947491.1 alanyl-tRNA synthetase [Kitasatospora gansuensis]